MFLKFKQTFFEINPNLKTFLKKFKTFQETKVKSSVIA